MKVKTKIKVGSLVRETQESITERGWSGFNLGLITSVKEDIGYHDHTGWTFQILPMGSDSYLVDHECNLELVS